jgi:uncharacterized protein (TIGR02145 family)
LPTVSSFQNFNIFKRRNMKTNTKLFIALLLFIGAISSCKKEDTTGGEEPPTGDVAIVTTTTVSNIAQTTVSCGGEVTSDGGSSITARGVCWGTGQTPTIVYSKTTDGTGIGTFTSNITGLTANTTYYVRAYATNSNGTSYGNAVAFTTLPVTIVGVPVLTTYPITGITQISASYIMDITNIGNSDIIESGICWSKNQTPTIADNKTIGSNGYITGLTVNTTYYARAYATNTQGTGYGNTVSFTTASIIALTFNSSLTYGTVTDIDGNVYKTITIGTQTWMAENLKTTKYRNGDLIGTTTADISNESNPKYQWPCGGDDSYLSVYGRLYTWYAATDNRNIAPTGWHVPSISELSTLVDYLGGGGRTSAPRKLKETGTNHWNTPNTSVTNESGFTAVPGGWRDPYGNFNLMGRQGTIWSTFDASTIGAGYLQIYYDDSNLGQGTNPKNMGFSIRCIKD